MDRPAEREDQVFRQVRRCMGALVGGSGHLSAYTLDRDSFRIEAKRDLEDGATEYTFVVQGWRVSEFMAEAYEPDDLEGSGLEPGSQDAPGSDGIPELGPGNELESDAFPEPGHGDEPEELRGTLVLDGTGELALDSDGRVRLAPWRTLDPEWL